MQSATDKIQVFTPEAIARKIGGDTSDVMGVINTCFLKGADAAVQWMVQGDYSEPWIFADSDKRGDALLDMRTTKLCADLHEVTVRPADHEPVSKADELKIIKTALLDNLPFSSRQFRRDEIARWLVAFELRFGRKAGHLHPPAVASSEGCTFKGCSMKNPVTISDLIERIAARSVEALGNLAGAEYVAHFSGGTMRMDAKDAATAEARQHAALFVFLMIESGEITPRAWTQLPATLHPTKYSGYWLRPNDVERALTEAFGEITQDAEEAEPQAAPVVTEGAARAKPLQRTAAQDDAILCEIKKQGHDPMALPKNQAGKPGVKAAIRAALAQDSLFVGSTIFDKAWVRLTTRADIVIQD